jgi:hypothetical protein
MNIVEVVSQGVVHIYGNHLPVGLALVDEKINFLLTHLMSWARFQSMDQDHISRKIPVLNLDRQNKM